ncbi:helix-turn-helix domain-containing protein [Candidatus Peregrinibacteria bacterium]|nr:MAG: helix-turn-helix domain-containing protein [Candidatus Peregrinibacteria bacterium]
MFILKGKGYSLRAIAKSLKRSVSTVSDELKRNEVNGSYNPKKAQQKSYVRRRSARFQGKKVAMNKKLRDFVEEKLRDDISPAAISGRLKCQEGALPFASKDSIYRFLKAPMEELWSMNVSRKQNIEERGPKYFQNFRTERS